MLTLIKEALRESVEELEAGIDGLVDRLDVASAVKLAAIFSAVFVGVKLALQRRG